MKIEDAIDIAAPPEVVWAVTKDVENWHEWTPTIDSVELLDGEPLAAGSRARIKQPGMPPAEWKVTSVTSGESFSWQATVRGIHMVATHEIAAAAQGTRNRLRIETSGVLAVLLWPLLYLSLRGALRKENAGLRRRCEEFTAG